MFAVLYLCTYDIITHRCIVCVCACVYLVLVQVGEFSKCRFLKYLVYVIFHLSFRLSFTFRHLNLNYIIVRLESYNDIALCDLVYFAYLCHVSRVILSLFCSINVNPAS